MKKKILSLLLFTVVALGSLAGCGVLKKNNKDNDASSESTSVESSSSIDSNSSSSNEPIEKIDYVSQLKLDMATESLKQEVSVKTYIDGDTTHFYPKGDTSRLPELVQDDGFLKARYAAVNTPESTGTIEEWGKKAAAFTKAKLETVKNGGSIMLETEGAQWEADSTKERFLVWVWYKPAGESEYRNLNLELLQEGLAVGSKAGNSRYGDICNKAISQAKNLMLHVYSQEDDPDFYYGSAIELDLKELRTNIAKYVGKRVAFEGTVTTYNNWTIYVEDYDAETQRHHGISVFYGYEGKFHSFLAVGNRVRIVGNLTYSENYGYQISSLKYDAFEPNHPENIQTLGSGYLAGNQEITVEQFFSKVKVETEIYNEETEEYEVTTQERTYADLIFSTSVSMKNLKVIDAYTTNNGGDNDGAISLTCKSGNNTIIIRVAAIEDEKGEMVFDQNELLGKTIDAIGIVDAYNGEYQIRVFLKENLIIH